MAEKWIMFAGTGASCINYAVTSTFSTPSVCSKKVLGMKHIYVGGL